MITIVPERPGTVRATFRMRCGVGRHEVCLIGEFNDWSPTANPMSFDGHAYVTEVILPTGRAYRFRYLVNGERCQIDWGADRFVLNEVGGCDSILDLSTPRTSMLTSSRRRPSPRHGPPASNRHRTEPVESV